MERFGPVTADQNPRMSELGGTLAIKPGPLFIDRKGPEKRCDMSEVTELHFKPANPTCFGNSL